MHALKMPDSLARVGVQGKQTICEEIIANAIGAVEIKCGRACRNVENSSLGIESHSSPIVGRATGLPRIFWPRVVAEFTGMRNGVKRPTQLAGSGVVSANIAWGRRESIGVAATEYHQVLVDDAWAGEMYRLRSGWPPAPILPTVEP